MTRKSYIILGVLLGLFGFGIIINPSIYHSAFRYQFDFTEIKWPFGGGLIILGCFFIWSSFRKKAIETEKKAKDEKKILMCPMCIKPYNKKDCQNLKCPDCQAPLEDLSGFYERHPDLRK
jgi:uncharacterized CHY-type Zn-finger protein